MPNTKDFELVVEIISSSGPHVGYSKTRHIHTSNFFNFTILLINSDIDLKFSV